MRSTVIGHPAFRNYTPKPHALDELARRALHKQLAKLECGALTIQDGAQTTRYGAQHDAGATAATVRVHDPRFYSEIAFGGSIGAGEAYMQGYWSADSLIDVMRILLQNRHVLDNMESGFARLTAPLQKILHWAARNSHAGSRRNIAAHYDLGNELFMLFLDPTMMYSCALFEQPEATLHEASVAKLDLICRKLDLKPDDHLVEIGTGWGGFALHAAKNYGCRVTTTTISERQYALASKRIAEAVLGDRITLLLEDYRNLQGQFEKLVSIEMIEAVGYQYYDTYFRKCSELLKPDGMMLLQAITIADQQYDAARRSVDFIQRYIFPGSCIPSVSAMCSSIARITDMRLFHLQDIGPHYATTLARWRDNFFANIEAVRKLGYPEEFVRMWDFYLCYCEAGFTERAIGDVHMLLTKPQSRRAAVL